MSNSSNLISTAEKAVAIAEEQYISQVKLEMLSYADAVIVDISTWFDGDRSHPPSNLFVFAYRVTVTNDGRHQLRLVGRSWIAEDMMGRKFKIDAGTVVGEWPVLGPGETFSYYTGIPFATPTGRMSGSLKCVVADRLGLVEHAFETTTVGFHFMASIRQLEFCPRYDVRLTLPDLHAIERAFRAYRRAATAERWAVVDTAGIDDLSRIGRKSLEVLLLKDYLPIYASRLMNLTSISPRLGNVPVTDIFIIHENGESSIRIIHAGSDRIGSGTYREVQLVDSEDYHQPSGNILLGPWCSAPADAEDQITTSNLERDIVRLVARHCTAPLDVQRRLAAHCAEAFEVANGSEPLSAFHRSREDVCRLDRASTDTPRPGGERAESEGNRGPGLAADLPPRQLTELEIAEVERRCSLWHEDARLYRGEVIAWVEKIFADFIPGLRQNHLLANANLYNTFYRAVRTKGRPAWLDLAIARKTRGRRAPPPPTPEEAAGRLRADRIRKRFEKKPAL